MLTKYPVAPDKVMNSPGMLAFGFLLHEAVSSFYRLRPWWQKSLASVCVFSVETNVQEKNNKKKEKAPGDPILYSKRAFCPRHKVVWFMRTLFTRPRPPSSQILTEVIFSTFFTISIERGSLISTEEVNGCLWFIVF